MAMKTNRRTFLQQSTFATVGGLLIPNFLKALERQPSAFLPEGNTLVIVQLSGGNDGLNTIVPFQNDIYYRSRPQIAIRKESVLKASDDLGFHPALTKLYDLYNKGYLTVINNVGYPNPDRSHFRSMEIWQTASATNEYLSTGWIGRYLDSACQHDHVAHRAIEMDDALSLTLKGQSVKGLAVKNPEKLYRAMHNDFFQHLSQGANLADGSSLNYLYKTLAETVSSADYIYNKSQIKKSATEYPNHEFGSRLRTIAELIMSGMDTKVYYLSLSGFDTHVRQPGAHQRLLQLYADAMHAFVTDLEKSGNLNSVMVMTFSEFGRRVAENASGGTDHGTANNLFLIGNNLKRKGFFNGVPDLGQLDQGDLVHQIDFRSVYATVLKNWMSCDDHNVLTGDFKLLDFI
jgi:uncharacterized protein (DUF1501 family)